MTLQEALVAYQTCARAEGKSPKTVAWIVSSAGYFAEFLGPGQPDIATITSDDLPGHYALRDSDNNDAQAALNAGNLRPLIFTKDFFTLLSCN
jgi:hypothetical protein